MNNSAAQLAKRGVNFGRRRTSALLTTKPRPENLPDLHKTRPDSPERLGQEWWKALQDEKNAPNMRLGFERLGHMQSVGIPFKFEEFQGRHPFDYVEETKTHFQAPPRPGEKSQRQVLIDDFTLLPLREWMEPIRKGQAYWDYCRDKWMSKVSQLGAALGPASSVYSLWTITDDCLKYGGSAFMIAYFIVTLLFTIPVIYMELAIGQFHRFGVVRSMAQVCPLMMGVGYLMLMLCIVDYLLSLTRLSWILYYMASSVRLQFPWTNCDETLNSAGCLTYNETVTYADGEKTPAVEFFRVKMMRQVIRYTIFGPGGWEIFACVPNIGVVLCFLCLLPCFHWLTKMKCQEMGRRMYFTFQLAFFLIIFCFASRSFVIPLKFERIVIDKALKWLFSTDNLVFLGNRNTWLAAFKHAIISSGVGTGIHMTFGSHNPFINHEIKLNAFFSGSIGFLLHCSLAIFLTICHFTLRMTKAFKDNRGAYGNDTVFEVFPHLAVQYQPSRGYSWLMFNSLMGAILLLGVLRGMCCLHTIQQYFCDKNKSYYEPLRSDFNFWEAQRSYRQKRLTLWLLSHHRKGILMVKLLSLFGLIQFLTFFPGGALYLEVAERLWYKYIIVLVISLEFLVVFFFLGVRLLNSYIRKMTTWQPTLWSRFVWKSITPIFPILYFVHFYPLLDPVKDNVSNFYGLYEYLGLICIAFLLILLLYQVVWTWATGPCRNIGHNLLLLATPEHDHADVIKGVKPLTRLHWMHHVTVPSGIARGACLRPKSYKLPVVRFNYPFLDKLLWNLVWNKLGLSFLNSGDDFVKCPCMPNYNGPINSLNMIMFNSSPVELKQEEELQIPKYLPNEQIANVINMRKRPVYGYRKQWIKERVSVQTEKIKAEIQTIEENEQRRKSIGGKPATFSGEKIEAISSSSEEDFSDDITSDEWEDQELSPDMSPGDEGSSDDDESDDWEHFSDNSYLSTDSSEEEIEQEGEIVRRKTIKKTDEQISFLVGDRSVENLLMRDKEYFENFRVDELEEFEEIMDDWDADKLSDHWTESTSETDTDESSDTIRKHMEDGEDMNDDDKVIISDVENMQRPSRKPSKQSGRSGGGRSALRAGDESFSSCSTSCSSGDSNWSRRDHNAPGLAEDRGMILKKGKKSLETIATKKMELKKRKAAEAITQVEAEVSHHKRRSDRKSVQPPTKQSIPEGRESVPGQSRDSNFFTDATGLKKFLQLNDANPRGRSLLVPQENGPKIEDADI